MEFQKHKMKHRLSLTIILLWGSFQLFPQIQVSLYDELEPLYPDMTIESPVLRSTMDVPVNAVAGFHLLATNLKPDQKIKIKIKGTSKNLIRTAKWYRMIAVPVTENTGLDSRTEKFSGKQNPFVIRKAPFEIFEVLEPVRPRLKSDNSTEAYRVEFLIDADTEPGWHDFDIIISTRGYKKLLNIKIHVYDVQIPKVSDANLNYVNWHSIGNLCRDHKVEKWSEPFWEMLKKYAELMAKGRQNTFWFIWSDFFTFTDEGQVQEFHPQRLIRYINVFQSAGLSKIQGAPFCRRRDWSTDAMLVSVPLANGGEITTSSTEGQTIIRSMADSICKLMHDQGWESQWYQGIFDEPTDQYIDRYVAVVNLLREIKSDLRILEATMTVRLTRIVDCWCPQVQEYQAHKDFFDQRMEDGDEVWVYTCLIPGGPWVNRLVDQERLRQVYIGWACSKYNLQGFLHWGFNHHRGQPFNQLVVQHGDEKNFLPAGDSHIVYPGPDAPWSSQRFEAHRIGMEDYELLRLLKAKDPVACTEITESLFRAFDDFDTKISKYRLIRKRLLSLL